MTTKTRTLGQSTDGRWSERQNCVWNNGGGILPYPMDSTVHNQSNVGNYAILAETITSGSGRGYNDCDHTKTVRKYHNGSIMFRYRWTNSVNPWYISEITITNPCNAEAMVYWGGTAGCGLTVPPFTTAWTPSWESAYAGQALVSMWPSVNASTSIPNFLYELKDLKGLQRSCLRILRLVNPRGCANLRDYIAKVSRGWAEFHLSKEFGIKPFVSDLRRIASSLKVARAETRRLSIGEGKVLTSHFTKVLTDPAKLAGEYNWFLASHSCKRLLTVEYDKSMYHATMKYHYSLGDFTRRNLDKLVLLDTLGINLNPKIIWDMLPWSFAVDWILGVGTFLDQFKIQAVQPTVVVDDFCHSVKTRRVITRSNQLQWEPTYIEKTKPAVIYEEIQSSYKRRRYIPSFYSALQLSGLSRREITLSAALALTRKK